MTNKAREKERQKDTFQGGETYDSNLVDGKPGCHKQRDKLMYIMGDLHDLCYRVNNHQDRVYPTDNKALCSYNKANYGALHSDSRCKLKKSVRELIVHK